MNAIQIAHDYSYDSIAAIGNDQGNIEIHVLPDKSEGRTGALTRTINYHKEAIVHLRMTFPESCIISVDQKGNWAYHEVYRELIHSGKIGMSKVLAHSDVKGKSIFMASTSGGSLELVKIDISSGNVVHAPKEATQGIETGLTDWGCRPIALDEHRAAFYIQLATQQLMVVDFEKQTFETIPLKYKQLTPEGLVSDPVIDISVSMDLGVRLDYHPLQKNEDGDYQLSAEVFRFSTGERLYSIPCDAIPEANVDPVLINGDQGSEAYKKARVNFAKRLTNIVIEEKGNRVWLTAKFDRPGVLCFDLEKKKHVGMVFSADMPEPKVASLDDAFEIDKAFKILGVNAFGKCVSFGFPINWVYPKFGNTFKVIRLRNDGKEPEKVKKAFLVSDEWAVINSGWDCFLIDVKTGKTLKHFQSEYFSILNGALSPDQKYIALGCDGACGFLWNLENGEVKKLSEMTISGPVLGWLDANTLILSSCEGGIIKVDIEIFNKEYVQGKKYRKKDPGHYGIKLDGEEVLENYDILEMQVEGATSDMFRIGGNNMVLQILGRYIGGGKHDEDFWVDKYVFNAQKIVPDSYMAKWDGPRVYAELLACNDKVIVRGGNHVFTYEANTGKKLNSIVLESDHEKVFVNMEQSRAYVYMDTLFELDLQNGERKAILEMPEVKGFSIAKNILLAQKEDHTIEVMDMDSGKSMVKVVVLEDEQDNLMVEKAIIEH